MDTKLLRAWAPRAVGRGDDLIVIGRPYGGSFQERNLAFLEEEMQRDSPDEAEKIYGAIHR